MKRLLQISIIFLVTIQTFYAQDKPNPKVNGLVFMDYFYNIDQRDSSKKDINGFQFRRIYATLDYIISESFESRFRLEADQSANSLTGGGKLGVMVKDAYLRWKNIFNGSDLFVGISPVPSYDVSEAAWGYRSLEKTVMDLFGQVSSRDFGVDLKGNINNEGSIKYWFKLGNNSNNGPELNKHKRFYGLLHFIPVGNFQFTVYGDYAFYPKKKDPLNNQFSNNSAFIGGLFVNYFEKGKYSFGIESFYKSQQNNFSKTPNSLLQSQNGLGISVFGWVAVNDMIKCVARFDNFDPNTDNDQDGTSFIIGALDFSVNKNVNVIPNLEYFKYQASDKKDIIARISLVYQM